MYISVNVLNIIIFNNNNNNNKVKNEKHIYLK